LKVVARSTVSNAELNEAAAKLQHLSEDRARRVVSLIDDLTQLELLENAEDLAAARATLAEDGGWRSWDEVKKELDAQFGSTQSAG
jgi:hypothetical protein